MLPKVTVGMPTFNRANVLKETIYQVLNQTFKDFELIIFNDGSSDNTAEILNSIVDSRIILLNSKNLGPPNPLNEILKLAKGEFIIILHDHDFFDTKLLGDSVMVLEKNPLIGFVLQGSSWIDENGISGYREMLLDLPEINNGLEMGIKLLTDPNTFDSIFHACCMIRRTSFEKVGFYFNTNYGLYADVDLWLRLLQISDFGYINKVYFKFRTREVSNHFLNNKEFEILDWVFKININNIENYFYNSDRKNEILKMSFKKRYKLLVYNTLFYAANRNIYFFRKGLNLLNEEKSGNHICRIVVKMLLLIPFFQKTLIQIAYLGNQFRKIKFV